MRKKEKNSDRFIDHLENNFQEVMETKKVFKNIYGSVFPLTVNI